MRHSADGAKYDAPLTKVIHVNNRERLVIHNRTFATIKEHIEAHGYAIGWTQPHYPVPALRVRTFEYWRNLGEVSALNNFDIEVVQRLNRYR